MILLLSMTSETIDGITALLTVSGRIDIIPGSLVFSDEGAWLHANFDFANGRESGTLELSAIVGVVPGLA